MAQRIFTTSHSKEVSWPSEARTLPPVVAMIVPAGDPSAFEHFFHRLPLSLGVCYLIMEYYGAPGGRTAGAAIESLPDLLERTTLLPVRALRQDTLLENDCIYLLPPASAIELVAGRLIFQGATGNGGNDYLADLFLASVATGTNGHCAAVLLPDMAARVLPGIRVVRDEGGFTIALDEQDPFNSPHPVHRCSLIDLFLTAPVAASRLAGLTEYFRGTATGPDIDAPAVLSELLLQLKTVDYSRFRQQDIHRRIHRRMAVHEIRRLDIYIALLQTGEEELNRLHDELQSVVSGFYTDPGLEAALVDTVLPRLLDAERRAIPLRIWLPHCAGGHQAYSVAMAITEFLDRQGSDLAVQLFVTCWNGNAIARARKGIFDNDEMAFVNRSRRKKFFIKKESHWQVDKTIREKCIFATHCLLKDSPFSHIDLVIGSAALIGFDAESCATAFRLFHYSLDHDGYLVADTRRAPAVPAEMYAPLEGCRGVYVPRAVTVNLRMEGTLPPPVVNRGEPEADKLLLSAYVPASFLVDEQFRVIRYYGNTEPFLRAGRDRSSRYLFRIVRDELVFELNDLIEATDKDVRSATKKGIQLGDDSEDRVVSIEMIPLRPFGGNRRLVVIREQTAEPAVDSGRGRSPSPRERRLQAMEKEVQEMRGLLLAADQDASSTQSGLRSENEDLQASNEEFLSLNKELRGLNEEITVMYDELVTRHKELNTLNDGLRAHIREIRSAADSAMAIVATLRRPIVVLREDLRIHTANRAFYLLFGVTAEQAVGHHLHTVGPEVLGRESVRGRLQKVQTDRMEMDFEVRHRPPDGQEKVLHFSANRIAGVPGLRSGILLTIDDVTGQRDIQRFKDELIGLATHEIRTPATSIRAYSELLAQELTHTDDRKSAFLVGKLSTQVDRLTGLTRDLLEVSRLTQGRIELIEDAFDLNGLINEIAAGTQATTSVPIAVDPLPPSPPFHGDRERIGRMLGTLLSNAAKYAGNAEQIGIRTVVTKENVHVSIRLPGSVMPVDQMKKILDHDGAIHDVLSNGISDISLGLYISSEIVRIHGGTITVSGEKEKGSSFSIVLPFEKKRVAELSAV